MFSKPLGLSNDLAHVVGLLALRFFLEVFHFLSTVSIEGDCLFLSGKYHSLVVRSTYNRPLVLFTMQAVPDRIANSLSWVAGLDSPREDSPKSDSPSSPSTVVRLGTFFGFGCGFGFSLGAAGDFAVLFEPAFLGCALLAFNVNLFSYHSNVFFDYSR